MVNPKYYSYRVIWSEADQEFVGLCSEFPSLSYLDEDQLAAFKGIQDLVKDVVADMEANGETVPEPFSKRNYSGKFQVRVLPELHRQLAREAAEKKVSLNRYISHILSQPNPGI